MRKIDVTNFHVATSETARQINRRIALNIIRRNPPMSRAELARRSGMQRSTVSAIVGQLIEEGWLTEGAVGPSARGRRPRLLHLNVERAGIVAVDLRPETTRVGLAGIDVRFVMQTTWPTPRKPVAFAEALARTVESFRRTHRDMVFEGMGVSLPGRVSDCGRLLFAPNLGWGQVELRDLLESTVGLPLVMENEATACALAELWFGRHSENVRHLMSVAVSEGVGVGVVLNGQLLAGGSMAGEFGHVTLDENGPLCGCGKRGCWEQYASNQAAVRYYRREDEGKAPQRGRGAAASSTLAFADILRFADGGDIRAVETLERMATYLGMGIAGLVMGLAPQVVVIVGEITAAWNRVGPIITNVVRRRSLPQIDTTIVPTDPGTQPRLRGAVTLVVQQHFGAPNVA
jgi:predicted NBD/HSP70 family sugar kinase